uniref:Uncharacterized protein n=1 Tax=Brassica oleracea var. oleracea TaxID=109376 RepID=A0A0D3CFU9_BRAOL
MGATSPERHREVAVTPFQSYLARATPRCRSRLHRSEAQERPYSDVPERHHKVAPAGSDVTGATQRGRSRRATRSDVSQRPLQVTPEAWSDLSERLLEQFLGIVNYMKNNLYMISQNPGQSSKLNLKRTLLHGIRCVLKQ